MSETLAVLANRTEQLSDPYAARTAIDPNDDRCALNPQEELGELIADYLLLTGRGRVTDQAAEAIRAARDDEAAEVLAVLLCCRRCDTDIEAALARKWFWHLGAIS